MKLLLTSSGFETSEIVDALVELCGKPKDEISFAVINEAYAVEEGDKLYSAGSDPYIVDNSVV